MTGGVTLSDDIKITYETLFDLLRREKNREDMQKLDSVFFDDVIEYLAEKVSLLKEQEKKHDLLSSDERNKTRNQLENIKKILQELYERREQKIIRLALNKSKTKSSSIDSSALLKEEKTFFDSLVSMLDHYRNSIIMNVLQLKSPKTEGIAGMVAEEPKKPFDSEQQNRADEKKKAEAMKAMEQSATRVIFINNVEQFIGQNLETIGPFAADQEAELPKDVAEVLIGKGDAERA